VLQGSPAIWRRAHIAFFSRECAQAGRTFQPDRAVVGERVRMLYPLIGR
jgi:uncharacterized protein YhfF